MSLTSLTKRTSPFILPVLEKVCGIGFPFAKNKHKFKALVVPIYFWERCAILFINHRIVQIKTNFLEEKCLIETRSALAPICCLVADYPNYHSSLFYNSVQFPRNTLKIKRISFVVAQIIIWWRGYGQIHTFIRKSTQHFQRIPTNYLLLFTHRDSFSASICSFNIF